jgi:hypothetical protein
MWMERIRSGVLEVHTETGPCYVRPSLRERMRLLWTFRNFRWLPRQVLSARELTLVSALLKRGNCQPNDEYCIGVIEWTASLLPGQSPTKQDGPVTPPTNPSVPGTTLASNGRPRSRRRRGRKSSQGATSHASVAAACPARTQ